MTRIQCLLWAAVLGLLVTQTRQLRTLQRKVRKILMKIEDVQQLIVDLDAVTNGIADKVAAEEKTIADLQAQIAAGTPVTQEQLDAVGASLAGVKAHLQAIGADPANPVPATV